MEELKVEYLVIINTENSFCNSKKAFNSLLSSYDDIIITKNKVKHLDLEVDYELQTDEIEENKQRFFHVKLICKNKDRIDEFAFLLKVIRGILNKATNNKPPQKIWDDISKYYSLAAYPFIHDIENLMRKLITKFMLISIGQGWEKEAIPEEVKKSSRTKPKDANYLYEVDFIQLSDFLFVKYGTVDVKVLLNKISSAGNLSDLNLEELKNGIPISNWERYFSPIVDCEDSYLEKRWSKLYEYRCKIAHNNDFNKTDYESTLKLYEEVKEKLQKATDNLDKIKLSDEDKEFIAENIAGTINELYGIFLNKWKFLTLQFYSLLKDNEDLFEGQISGTISKLHGLERYKYSIIQMTRLLAKMGLINSEELQLFTQLNVIRNYMVHEPEIIISEIDLKNNISLLNDILADFPQTIIERILKKYPERSISITKLMKIDNLEKK